MNNTGDSSFAQPTTAALPEGSNTDELNRGLDNADFDTTPPPSPLPSFILDDDDDDNVEQAGAGLTRNPVNLKHFNIENAPLFMWIPLRHLLNNWRGPLEDELLRSWIRVENLMVGTEVRPHSLPDNITLTKCTLEGHAYAVVPTPTFAKAYVFETTTCYAFHPRDSGHAQVHDMHA